jgi:hypothetical protein
VWDWIHGHHDLIHVFKKTANRADGDLAGHVTIYLMPFNPARSTQCALAHSALDFVDWDQIKWRLTFTVDGRDPRDSP